MLQNYAVVEDYVLSDVDYAKVSVNEKSRGKGKMVETFIHVNNDIIVPYPLKLAY